MVEWWTCLLRCSALWSANRLEEAATLYPDIDDLFPALYQVSQPRTPNLQAEVSIFLVSPGPSVRNSVLLSNCADWVWLHCRPTSEGTEIEFETSSGCREDSVVTAPPNLNYLFLGLECWRIVLGGCGVAPGAGLSGLAGGLHDSPAHGSPPEGQRCQPGGHQ